MEVVVSQLKERILATSLMLFEKHGFHSVTVNDIVEASGTSKGGFYHHYRSKDDLLFSIHDTFISYVLAKAKEANRTCQTPAAKLAQIIHSFARVFDLYQPHISVFYQESKYLKPELDQLIKVKRDEYRLLINEVIASGQASGEFRREIPFDISGMAILGIVNWTSKWYQRNGERSIEEIADIFTDFIMHALLTDEAKETYSFYFLDKSKALTNITDRPTSRS